MKNNKKGMALLAALITAFIFLALVSTLVLLATSGNRQANYAKKATIALHLAEAGIADALYRLNYGNFTTYPFGGSSIPTFSGEISNVEADNKTINGTLEKGIYKITFTDETGGDTDLDKITSVGDL